MICRSAYAERGLKLREIVVAPDTEKSLCIRGAWIEIENNVDLEKLIKSLCIRGAWIEISMQILYLMNLLSLCIRGAWIEIWRPPTQMPAQIVALHTRSVD